MAQMTTVPRGRPGDVSGATQRQIYPIASAFRRSPEVLPSAGTLLFRWALLCSIVLLAAWAFLGTTPDY
jgi:hypothetical protein